jgi:hypothetical protein
MQCDWRPVARSEWHLTRLESGRRGVEGQRPPDAETCGHPSGNPSVELTRPCSRRVEPTTHDLSHEFQGLKWPSDTDQSRGRGIIPPDWAHAVRGTGWHTAFSARTRWV